MYLVNQYNSVYSRELNPLIFICCNCKLLYLFAYFFRHICLSSFHCVDLENNAHFVHFQWGVEQLHLIPGF